MLDNAATGLWLRPSAKCGVIFAFTVQGVLEEDMVHYQTGWETGMAAHRSLHQQASEARKV